MNINLLIEIYDIKVDNSFKPRTQLLILIHEVGFVGPKKNITAKTVFFIRDRPVTIPSLGVLKRPTSLSVPNHS